MLKWKIKNNVISELLVKEKNIINPWGIETADSWAFFSMEDNIGYRYEVKDKQANISDTEFKTYQRIKMNEGEWTLETRDQIEDNKIIRSATLTCLQESFFMDFVVRFRFKKSDFDNAIIAGRTIAHTASNIYHQYPVEEAALKGNSLSLKVKILESQCEGKFKPHLYVRDHQDEWVVHARMIPIVEDKNVIKLCSRYFKTSPLPQVLTNGILSFKNLKTYLWYHSEHSPYKTRLARFFSPNAFPLVKLQKNQQLKWKVEVTING